MREDVTVEGHGYDVQTGAGCANAEMEGAYCVPEACVAMVVAHVEIGLVQGVVEEVVNVELVREGVGQRFGRVEEYAASEAVHTVEREDGCVEHGKADTVANVELRLGLELLQVQVQVQARLEVHGLTDRQEVYRFECEFDLSIEKIRKGGTRRRHLFHHKQTVLEALGLRLAVHFQEEGGEG